MITEILAVAASVVSGLGAGVFLAFSSGVMPGLARTSDAVYVESMRGINRAVINGVFLGAIFGAVPLLVAAAVAAFAEGATAAGWLLTASGLVYLAGVLVVTGIRNVPLNERLERHRGTPRQAREDFERPWVRWNGLRTVAGVVATVLAVSALIAL
ncbi:putative membrane protein [Diaminobutyricimonas aerilata]|uniref:Putative membrane protein n=1 Tax=Diaminobutyricimonas aerilata TaxID=1162967 RepID=A0A2M9CNH9_9MICO|nr:anthrone oxygenase family protein [Diaminobutyricimonas aerilata]PJJ73461.1 putative membrane protein [Diaminobutyricimonas aerilata]